ncbi:MAG: YhfC family intramembrane metalloprotease [candidate division WOR-3 bacterium]|nr:MAG: YhfC family intramembrane metalloprotease [candidate division WOR-3 bacterium]
MNGYILLLSLCITLVPGLIRARSLLTYSGTETPSRDTVYTFSFTLSENNTYIIMDAQSDLERGTLNIWLGGGGYEVIGNYTDKGTFHYENIRFGPLNDREEILVRITPTRARGKWSIHLTEHTGSTTIFTLLVSGFLIVIISVLFIVFWKKKCRSSFRWFFIGGLVWFVGVALKFLFAYFLNSPILMALNGLLPRTGYLLVGSLYIGSLTGVFEIGATLLFAILIRSVYANRCRAVGIGIGAGTTEALFIGLSQIGSIVMVSSGIAGSAEIISSVISASFSTPAFALVAPVERLLVILCHVSSRMLVLYAVSRKKPSYFWAAFALLTAIDTVAGYVHLAGLVNTVSMWWIELVLLPFAVASIFIIQWCLKNWGSGEHPQDITDSVRG